MHRTLIRACHQCHAYHMIAGQRLLQCTAKMGRYLRVATLPESSPAVSSAARNKWSVCCVCWARLGSAVMRWRLIDNCPGASGPGSSGRAGLLLARWRGRQNLLSVVRL